MVYNMGKRWNNLIRTIEQKRCRNRVKVTFLQAIFFKRAEKAVSLTALKWVSGFPEKKLINKTRGSSVRVLSMFRESMFCRMVLIF